MCIGKSIDRMWVIMSVQSHRHFVAHDRLPRWPRLAENVMFRSGVRPSVTSFLLALIAIGHAVRCILNVIYQLGCTRRGQRTFSSEYQENGHTRYQQSLSLFSLRIPINSYLWASGKNSLRFPRFAYRERYFCDLRTFEYDLFSPIKLKVCHIFTSILFDPFTQ